MQTRKLGNSGLTVSAIGLGYITVARLRPVRR
jgi:aryl-alcohol dehydrogenase-like predicted oxidoreductase